MSRQREEVAEALRKADDIIIASHYNPDGDAIGSSVAMAYLLRALGKNVAIYNATGMPRTFDWMETPCPVLTELPRGYSWVVALDCGDLARTGPELQRSFGDYRTINIDHHLGNPEFADLNWVKTTYSSTGEMVARLCDHFGVDLSGPLGEAVYTALVTDTGYFSYDNTTTRTMRVAERIMELGLKPGPINARIQNQWTPARLCLMGNVLGRAEMRMDGQLGLIRITRRALEECGADATDADGLINMLRQVRGVRIAVSLREDGPEEIKFSLRSHGDTNVQPVAAAHNGGGHKNAAGGTIFAPMEEAAGILISACREVIAG
ncbi:DHH family phosphoesterase [Desulfohalovibrio reitneri]|uniref:DHH family phosphoesterase n=1 Tax=Desulfohalovibrio reitneri TaxID=1307759 RepID=UPI0004A6D32C|nr:bifunctional oligoribonuclease/PAP phosphatase NrnA [Desulfohalovibrio reitneri]